MSPHTGAAAAKRAVVLRHLLRGRIIALQETHWDEAVAARWGALFPGSVVLAAPARPGPNGGRQGGVAIILPAGYRCVSHRTLYEGCALEVIVEPDLITGEFSQSPTPRGSECLAVWLDSHVQAAIGNPPRSWQWGVCISAWILEYCGIADLYNHDRDYAEALVAEARFVARARRQRPFIQRSRGTRGMDHGVALPGMRSGDFARFDISFHRLSPAALEALQAVVARWSHEVGDGADVFATPSLPAPPTAPGIGDVTINDCIASDDVPSWRGSELDEQICSY